MQQMNGVLMLNNCVQSFFDCLFVSLKHNQSDELFNHAHEQNATKFGYGNGKNGKGKTAGGLEEALSQLRNLVPCNSYHQQRGRYSCSSRRICRRLYV